LDDNKEFFCSFFAAQFLFTAWLRCVIDMSRRKCEMPLLLTLFEGRSRFADRTGDPVNLVAKFLVF
jgi:hypothetical protein